MKIVLPRENAESNTTKDPAKYDYTNYKISFGNINEYRIFQRLGRGKYSEVFKGVAGKGGKGGKVVIKSLKPVREEKIRREVLVLRELNHPNIIKIRDVVYDPQTETHSLIFNYVQHKDFMDILNHITLSDIKTYSRQLVEALKASHSKGIFHRDIKPQNLIINTHSKHLIVIDWGLAEFYHPGLEYSVRVSSRHYKAPELLLEYPYYDYGIDMWSVGCVIAELVFRRSPFFSSKKVVPQIQELIKILGTADLKEYIRKFEISFEIPEEVGFPEKRVSFEEYIPLEQREAYKDVIDLLNKLLVYDHTQRYTASECLQHPFFKL